jgi:hypothetical protein
MNSNNTPDEMSTVIDNGATAIDNGNHASYHLNNFDEEEFEDYVMAAPSYICTDNFDCLEDEQDKMFHRSAYNCITQLELWSWIQRNSDPFMFNKSPEMRSLDTRMAKDEINGYHSGASYAWIMRQMEFIAKHGYEEFRQQALQRH